MRILKGVGIGILVFVALTVIGFAFQGTNFFMYKFWAPKYEGARREVFEQTKSYQQGMIQDLRKSQEEFVQADPEQQRALATVILHRVADFPEEDLPSDLRVFLADLRKLTNVPYVKEK